MNFLNFFWTFWHFLTKIYKKYAFFDKFDFFLGILLNFLVLICIGIKKMAPQPSSLASKKRKWVSNIKSDAYTCDGEVIYCQPCQKQVNIF
jgi:hypothetical protein